MRVRVRTNTLPLSQVLAERVGTRKPSEEDRPGLTALFRPNLNPHGTFRLGMGNRLDPLGPVSTPRSRTAGTATCR